MTAIHVVITTRFEAVHYWPECPHEDVGFLRNTHRHVFHIKCLKEVRHADRDVEIIRLKRGVDEWLSATFPTHDLGSKSCEQLALLLISEFGFSAVEVLEDGENGALVTA